MGLSDTKWKLAVYISVARADVVRTVCCRMASYVLTNAAFSNEIPKRGVLKEHVLQQSGLKHKRSCAYKPLGCSAF